MKTMNKITALATAAMVLGTLTIPTFAYDSNLDVSKKKTEPISVELNQDQDLYKMKENALVDVDENLYEDDKNAIALADQRHFEYIKSLGVLSEEEFNTYQEVYKKVDAIFEANKELLRKDKYTPEDEAQDEKMCKEIEEANKPLKEIYEKITAADKGHSAENMAEDDEGK